MRRVLRGKLQHPLFFDAFLHSAPPDEKVFVVSLINYSKAAQPEHLTENTCYKRRIES